MGLLRVSARLSEAALAGNLMIGCLKDRGPPCSMQRFSRCRLARLRTHLCIGGWASRIDLPHLVNNHGERSQKTRPQPFRWLIGNLDAHLQETYREPGVGLARDEQPEVRVTRRKSLRCVFRFFVVDVGNDLVLALGSTSHVSHVRFLVLYLTHTSTESQQRKDV